MDVFATADNIQRYVMLYSSSMTKLRQGSNEIDSPSSTARSSPVMLRCAQHLAAARDRPFAEFTLSAAHGLRVTLRDCSNGQGQFVQIEPCLTLKASLRSNWHSSNQRDKNLHS